MKKAKDSLYFDSSLPTCVRSRDGNVISQNENCRKCCGERMGARCEDRCALLGGLENPLSFEQQGFQLHKRVPMDGHVYDVLFIQDGEKIVTMLFPMDKSIQRELESFEDKNLTHTEAKIVELILKGNSNSDIETLLGITHSTLKTHLNHIYKKLPNHRIGNRVSS